MKRALALFVTLPILAAIGIVFAGQLAHTSHAATGCTISPWWLWTDNQVYSNPPSLLNVGQTINADVKFVNCNGATNVYLKFSDPVACGVNGNGTVGLNNISANSGNENQTAKVSPQGPGQCSYKAYATMPNGSTYSQGSSAVTVEANCQLNVNFNATPSQVNSPNQNITLTANVTANSNTCTNPNVNINFLANGTQISGASQNASLSPGSQQTFTFSTTPSSLNLASGTTVPFSVEIDGQDCASLPGAAPICTPVNKVYSSPVNVGIGTTPTANAIYTCTNNSCVQCTNSNCSPQYQSLQICGQSCGGGNAGGGAGTGAGGSGAGGGGSGAPGASVSITLDNPLGSCSDLTCAAADVINFIFTLAIPILGIMLLVGGFQMLTSAGNPEKFSSGKKTILYSVIGFIVILLAGSVANFIKSIFGG